MDHGLKDVRHWLGSFQLQDYVLSFIDHGFTSLEKCCHLKESHLFQFNIPQNFHSAILQSVKNLQNVYPDHNKLMPKMAYDDTPPPLPEKKTRKSLPSPRSLNKRETPIKSSFPPPPIAPPRSSVLRRSCIEPLAYDANFIQTTTNFTGPSLFDTLPPPPPYINPDLIDLFPPPPDPIDVPTESVQENNSIIHDMVKITLTQDVTCPHPPEINSQKKVKPPIMPRPFSSLKPSFSPLVCNNMSTYEDFIIPTKIGVASDAHLSSISTSNTLPSQFSPHFDEIKTQQTSSTLPNTRNKTAVSALVNRFGEEQKIDLHSALKSDANDMVRKNTVRNIARNISIPMQPIPCILPENSTRMRYIIPNRQKIEPVVVRGAERSSLGSRQTMGDSSDDTLDTSGEEDNKDTIGDQSNFGLNSYISRNDSSKEEAQKQKVRMLSDGELRDKKWDTKSGWLWKQGGHRNNRGWKKRWFVFAEDKFTYYTSDKQNAESLSCIALSNFKEVKIAQTEKDNSRQKYPFELITKHRTYLLAAETSEERTLWCSILMIAITQYKGSILDDLLGGQMSSPDKAGHLKKQGNSRLRDWKTRYCAVKDGTFCYYESYEAYCIATPINSIYCGTLKAQISDRTRFKFEVIVPNRTYYFLAQSESEMMSWIESLTAAVAAALTDFKSSGSTAKELIQRIHEEPSNAFCADCNAPDPKWASINLGVVVCIKCSGSHRILGVHISKVRSLELDVKAWTDDMVSVFHRVGNRRANEFFESTLDPSHPRPSPDSDMKVRESFIEEKYTRGTWSATICAPAAELDQQLIQVVQTDELDKTLALLMSGADVKYIDTSEDASRRTPYLMALASGQKAQAQLLLLNDADPVLPQENNESSDIDMTVDMEGVLEKRGPTSIQPYKRRKCVLTGKLMRYFDDSSLKNEIDLHTMIDVEMGQSEQPDDEKQSEEYSYLRVRTDLRTYIFRDRDRDYISRWYDALKSTQVFGVPIDKQPKTPSGIPLFIHKCIIFLENKLDSEGIYRVSGVKTRIEKLRLAFNQRIHDVILTDAENPTNDVTSLLKQYFRELPESLLGSWNSALTDAVQIDDETERLYQIQDLVYELPGTEFHTLKILIQHLYNVAQQQPLNKMNSENIGVIFGPTLMSVHDPGSDFNCYEYQLISTLIDYFPWVFQVDIEEEATKGKELKLAEAELRKIMSSIDAPHGSAENSWIVEVFHKHNSVNIRIESGQKLRDVSAEILTRSKLADGDFALHEFLCNGQLQRPIHLSEYLLNTTVTLWDERVHRSWLAIDYNNLKERLKVCDSIPLDATEQGSLHLYEGKKKWKEVHCKLSHDNFTFSKLKVKTTLNLLNYTWYLGSEANVASPTRFCFSLRCLNPTKDHKEEIFKVFCAPDEFELWRWLSRINSVKVKEPDYRLVRSKRANLQNPNNRNSFILLER